MAIKVGGTTVVDDSRNLTGVAATLTGTLTTKNISETAVVGGNSGTASTVDLSLGTVFTYTLNGNCTFTITNATGVASFTLILTNDATPSRSVAWAYSGGTFKYPGGSVSRTTTAAGIDVWFFTTYNGGTNWFGSIPMSALA